MLHPPQQMRSGRELLFFGDVYCFTAAQAEKYGCFIRLQRTALHL